MGEGIDAGAITASACQRSSAYAVMVGDTRVTAILDSQVEAPHDLMIGLTEDSRVQRQNDSLIGATALVTINCFLIERDGDRVLVDAGLGGSPTDTTGRLERELATLGLGAADVSHILLTHLHADHFGGLIDPDGNSRFPDARIIAHRDEHTFCFLQPEPNSSAPIVDQYRQAQGLRPMLHQFHWVDEGTVLPGIELVHLPGHTPGHSGFRIRDGADTLLLWGDIVHQPLHQFPETIAGVAFDVDPAQARFTRQWIMKEAAASREVIAGSHTDFPAFGRVRADADGYRFMPLLWNPAVRQTARL